MTTLRIRDASGRVVLYLDGDAGVPRDVNGKPVGAPVGNDADAATSTRMAARWMRGATLMDLSVGDVLKPGTEYDMGIPHGEDYVADVVSPVRYIKHDRGYWYTENVNDAIKLVAVQANLTGQQPEIQPGFTSTLFTCTGYGVCAKLPRELLSNADMPLRKRVLRLLVDTLRRAREARIATQLTTSTNYAAANRIAATAKWNGGANPAQLKDLFGALAASYLPADTLILPDIAAQYFFFTAGSGSTGAQVRDYVQSGGQLPRILYARAKQMYNGAAAYIWMPTGTGNVALIRTTVHDGPLAGQRTNSDAPLLNDPDTDIGSSLTLRWLGEGAVKDGLRVDGVLVREFEDTTDRNTNWIVVAVNDAEIMPSNLVGSVITGAIA